MKYTRCDICERESDRFSMEVEALDVCRNCRATLIDHANVIAKEAPTKELRGLAKLALAVLR